MVEELAEQYQKYLLRFTENIGEVPLGSFAKFNGKLVKKLTFDEFAPLHAAFATALRQYHESMERGDTINDLLVRAVRDRATDLLVVSPL